MFRCYSLRRRSHLQLVHQKYFLLYHIKPPRPNKTQIEAKDRTSPHHRTQPQSQLYQKAIAAPAELPQRPLHSTIDNSQPSHSFLSKRAGSSSPGLGLKPALVDDPGRRAGKALGSSGGTRACSELPVPARPQQQI